MPMHVDTVHQVEDERALPFRRFDVVDDALNVLLSGPSFETLAPVRARRLEPKLATEVRALISGRRRDKSKVGVGLIDIDYGVRILENAALGPGYHLVCTERTTIRGPFERLVRRGALDDSEVELTRLLIVGHDFFEIAFRLGTLPGDVERATVRLLAKLHLTDRGALVRLIFPNVTSRRKLRSYVGRATAER